MGMPAINANEFTFEMWEALPDDGNRYEIIDGELVVNAAPRNPHQAALGELHRLIANYLHQHRVARVLFSPADIRIDSHNLVQPDLFVVERHMRDWREITSLLLAVEVLSPTTARLDRVRKRPLYQRFNVPEYWIVDADARLIERWRPSDERPQILEKSIEWQPNSGAPSLVIDLPLMFRDALDE
jgi:Uma2 family endonuclease